MNISHHILFNLFADVQKGRLQGGRLVKCGQG